MAWETIVLDRSTGYRTDQIRHPADKRLAMTVTERSWGWTWSVFRFRNTPNSRGHNSDDLGRGNVEYDGLHPDAANRAAARRTARQRATACAIEHAITKTRARQLAARYLDKNGVGSAAGGGRPLLVACVKCDRCRQRVDLSGLIVSARRDIPRGEIIEHLAKHLLTECDEPT